MPRSEQDILSAVDTGDLIETATFDAKSALPGKGKSKDLAVDVAAMSADGGTLLYGVAEDENDRLRAPQPFLLAGARERVDHIVRTSISEPPAIEVHAIPTDDDPSVGYLVVNIPALPRAPHMVTVGKEHRYYGRGATGNVPLSEGEVAHLYERRQRWEVDRDAMLQEVIDAASIEYHRGTRSFTWSLARWYRTMICLTERRASSAWTTFWTACSHPP
jgi:predicted HTH transcriptional regulator